MTIASESARIEPDLSWLSGNARLTNLSGQLLGAHIAHAGLMMFWAGAITLSEVSRIDPGLSLGEQNLTVLPHLAALGWGVGAGGVVVDSYPYFVVGMLHLAASAALGAGGLFHVFRGPANLKDGRGWVKKFHYEWTDKKQLGLILGHHLLFLGAAALLFVGKATTWGGLYDGAIHDVRLITEPTTNPVTIFGYIFGLNHGVWNPLGMASVNNLEDVVGGHLWIGFICIAGGIWHIVKAPFGLGTQLPYNGDAILSYSLAGLGWMGLVSGYFVAYNTTVFPADLYGFDRGIIAGIQFGLGFAFLAGHIWHALKGRMEAQSLSEADTYRATLVGFGFLALLVLVLVLS
ncbi:chlorophyll a/b binding light-harvesting protein [Oscillatoriales cyanobacterium LEGE 11467]|uniref:Chlorophyll a/b binding light-harvesting protein n=1 Tax=Zarconia navalis LEGE 11467 TaxID=1828826 RepID=A0A928Z9B8_9CYAN|nr:chlorophyll a/b binding light-harvesting protein [Zarconia navalis]MBE9041529.1 chlorophyll a/b binding light-harvesting protein [Zarconia navalis LEGE 11467]